MKLHQIKIEQKYFELILSNRKHFELRKNDRNYKTNDIVLLQEFNYWTQSLTKREILIRIKEVFKDLEKYGLQDGYCIFEFDILTTFINYENFERG